MSNKKKLFSVIAVFVLMFTIFSFNKHSFAACPGDGPAKPVSSVEILETDINPSGDTILEIRVMGYGRDFVKLDGRQLHYFEKRPIVITCAGADGFLYRYNCGRLNPKWGYRVEAKFTSDNFPYNSVSTTRSI